MVNCAHPEHFRDVLATDDWARRIRGLRCNASRLSHAELDACETLDDGNPVEFGEQYRHMYAQLPWLNIVGGCCGSDLRHVSEAVQAIAA
jgi:homocysteine S-methyltransferase